MNATAAQLAVSCFWLVGSWRVNVDKINLLDGATGHAAESASVLA